MTRWLKRFAAAVAIAAFPVLTAAQVSIRDDFLRPVQLK
jgi:hypothetical protein